MKVIMFDGCNREYAKDQPEYLPLPAHQTEDGRVTSCWKMNLRERLIVLLTGRMYLTAFTFNKPLQPLLMGVSFKEVMK